MNVHEYVNNYEFRGDGADHTPTEDERAMLEDAIEGYLHDRRPTLGVLEADRIKRLIDVEIGDHEHHAAIWRALQQAFPS